MQRRAGLSVIALAASTAVRHASATFALSALPRPAVMSTVSDENRISVAESSRNPSSDEISPSVVQPISAISGNARVISHSKV